MSIVLEHRKGVLTHGGGGPERDSEFACGQNTGRSFKYFMLFREKSPSHHLLAFLCFDCGDILVCNDVSTMVEFVESMMGFMDFTISKKNKVSFSGSRAVKRCGQL